MSLIEHAQREFELLGWPGDCEMQKAVCDNVLDMLRVFAEEGHSGSSAPYTLGIFYKLAQFHTISPLTGEDDEWNDVAEEETRTLIRIEGIPQSSRMTTARIGLTARYSNRVTVAPTRPRIAACLWNSRGHARNQKS